MASRLVPCSSCSRHIKLGPTSCPFCGADAPTNVAPRPAMQGRPLSRAAVLFASATAVAACSSSSAPSKDAGDDVVGVAAYGVAVYPDTGTQGRDADQGDDAAEGDATTGHPQPAYGVMARDAGLEDDGGAVAAYGVAIQPDAGK